MDTLKELKAQALGLSKEIESLEKERLQKLSEIEKMRNGPFSGGKAAYDLNEDVLLLRSHLEELRSLLEVTHLQIANFRIP